MCTEKCKYLLTEGELSDILTERLLGKLRPNCAKCDEAGDCGENFGNEMPVTFVEYVRRRSNSAIIGRLRTFLLHAYIACTEFEPGKDPVCFSGKV